MSALDKKRMLEDILNDYVASEPNPNHSSLEKWIRKYPEYKEELTEFAVNWSLMENIPPFDDIKDVESVLASLTGIEVERTFLMPQAATKDQYLKTTPVVAELCKQTGLIFSPRLQIMLFDNARGT